MKDGFSARLIVWANAEILTFLLQYWTRKEAQRVIIKKDTPVILHAMLDLWV